MAWTVSGIDIFDQFPVIRCENVVLGICQPRPQGLLLDDFQNGGSMGEDSGQR